MPTPTKGPRLGGGPAHERLLLAGLATQLFEHRRITTTEAKAKRVRPLAERMITFAKRGDLASRRRVLTVVRDKGVVHVLFTEIAPLMLERQGGYTRITKIGNRKGDNAPMAVIELITEPLTAKQATVREAEAATRRGARKSAPARQPAAAEPEPAATLAAGPEAPYGAGSIAAPEDGSAPGGHPIKGDSGTMTYHEPDSPTYGPSAADVWFATPQAAEAAGFEKAGGPSDPE